MKKAVMLCVVVVFLALLSQISFAEQSCTTDADCGSLMCTDYYASLCLQNKCAPLLYSENPCGKQFATAVIKPTFATSASGTFGITVWTSSDATCKYSVMLQKDYDNMIQFEQTGSRMHTIASYSPAFDKTPFFTNCKASSGTVYSGRFDLVKDTTAPVISVKAVPDVITDLPLATKISVTSDELVVCKYDVLKSTYGEMSTYFSSQNENNASSYLQEVSQLLTGLVDKTMYALNVSCKNYAGNISPTARVIFSVNTSVEGKIVNTTPADGTVISQSSLFFEVYTTRSSVCYYGNITSPTTLIDSTEGNHHKSSVIQLNPGKYVYYIMCSFKEGQQLKTLPLNFIIDTTPPLLLLINDSPSTGERYTYSLTTLSASWKFEDNESSIGLYNYSVSDGGGAITNWITTTDTKATVSGLNLTNGKTYYFNVMAQNGAGMWSQVGRSSGITVDLSRAPVSCTNTLMDGNETDVDCGGGKCPVCVSGKMCEQNSDCKTGFCSNNNVCAVASCTDGVKNQGESDIDCGGPCAKKCDESDDCLRDLDCSSQNCINNICVGTQNTCINDVLDGGETDVDCGGLCASLKGQKCTLGKSCEVDEDCLSSLCSSVKTCAKAGDADGDGVLDSADNCPNSPNKDQKDADKDRIGDACDKDNDNDGITDSWEQSNGLDPSDQSDASQDNDRDGLSNLQEFKSNTDPNLPDSDSDGVPDKKELDAGTNPIDPESKPASPTAVIIVVALSLVAIFAVFGGIYYKKAIAPSKIAPVSKMPNYSPSDWNQQAVQPQPPSQDLNRHRAFEMKHEKKVLHMKKVFKQFEPSEAERPSRVEPPPPTDNIFDKFAEIPTKSGEEVFDEIKKDLEEEEKKREQQT